MMRPILAQWLWSGYGLVTLARRLIDGLVMPGWHTEGNLIKSPTTTTYTIDIVQTGRIKMIQQTQTVQDLDNKTVHKATRSLTQSFVSLLRFFWGVIRKIAANILFGFHIFVKAGEQRVPSYKEHWWNSPDTVDDVFNR